MRPARPPVPQDPELHGQDRLNRQIRTMSAFVLPPEIASFVQVTEVADGHWFVDELFQRKFSHPAPKVGRHVITFVRDHEARLQVASYVHFWRQDVMGFIGGGSTDGRVLRSLPVPCAELINKHGGLLRQGLLYAFDRFATDGLEAFFGHCGDARAKSVDLAAGFIETEDPHLLVKWVDMLSVGRQRTLIDRALAIGAF